MRNIDFNKDLLTIGEFSELTGISVRVLRHYDETGVFRPAKRGREINHQYRYYSPTQVTTVKMIRVLSEIGVPLDVIRGLAQRRTPETLLKLLRKYNDKTADEMRFLSDRHSVIKTYMELLYDGITVTEDEIRAAEMPEKRIILGGVNDFSGESGFMREYARFCAGLCEPKMNASYPIGGYFDSMATFLNEPSQPTRFFSLDPKGNEKREAGLYLIGHTRGYYGQTNDLPQKMAAFAKKNGLLFSGPVYNTYPFNELSIADPEQYLLQVCAAVTETRRVPSRRPLRHL